MNRQTWKITTINVQGINDHEKFDDFLDWITQEDFDIVIITKTKLHPSNAFFNFSSKNNNFFSYWSLDPSHPKGSGVGVIFKHATLGKHNYTQTDISGRLIHASLKFKGKITIHVIGIYGPADHSDKDTKDKIIHYLNRNVRYTNNTYYIIAGDLNEAPSTTPIMKFWTFLMLKDSKE